jgi:tRNA threonylcarbamoyladenosine biosynthesis protein TsaE
MRKEASRVFAVESTDELTPVAHHLSALYSKHPLFLFFGEMGAGKTTLIRELGRALGVTEPMSSPTFSIVNEHQSAVGTVYHFDLYRLESEEELEAIGFGEYLDSGYLCLVEWPERAPFLLKEPHVRIDIQTSEHLRTITVTSDE